MNADLVDTRFMLLSSIADKIAEMTNVEDDKYKQLIFEYRNIHYILHSFDNKWIISYPEQDKYWFDYIEDHPPLNLDFKIDGYLTV